MRDGVRKVSLLSSRACCSFVVVNASEERRSASSVDSVKQDVWFTDKHLGRPDKTIVAAQGATARWLLGGQTVNGTVLNH
jgi:hypothetical protein